VCSIQGGPERKEGFCLNNLCTHRVSLADRKQHSDGDILSYDRLSGRKRAGVTQECREMIHITNQYLLHSFSATYTRSECVRDRNSCRDPFNLAYGQVVGALRSDFNHILWLFTITRMRCLQETLSHFHVYFFWTQTSRTKKHYNF